MHDSQDDFPRSTGGGRSEAKESDGLGTRWKQFEELEQQLAETRQELEETKKRYLRMAADFNNYRKRAERNAAMQVKGMQKELLLDLVNMLDGLEEAQKQVREPSALQGIELILRRFHEVLRKHGCTSIECLGKPYNPELHEGVAFEEVSDYAAGCVAEEIQRGYKFGEELLRPAKVMVAKHTHLL